MGATRAWHAGDYEESVSASACSRDEARGGGGIDLEAQCLFVKGKPRRQGEGGGVLVCCLPSFVVYSLRTHVFETGGGGEL